MHNRLIKNKFLRENLILVIVLTLIFPPYLFSDAWVADTGNKQVSRLYKEGHAPTRIKVANNTAPVLGDTEICVNLNPTALFYPGLKLSFGDNRKDVYEIQSIRYDASIPATPWIVGFYNLKHADVTDSPIYMELVRAAGPAPAARMPDPLGEAPCCRTRPPGRCPMPTSPSAAPPPGNTSR